MSSLTELTKEQLATLTVDVSNRCPTCDGRKSIARLPKCPECGHSHILVWGLGLPCNRGKHVLVLTAADLYSGWQNCYDCGGTGRVTEWVPLADVAEAIKKLLMND